MWPVAPWAAVEHRQHAIGARQTFGSGHFCVTGVECRRSCRSYASVHRHGLRRDLAAIWRKRHNQRHTENHTVTAIKTGRFCAVFRANFCIPKPCVFGILKWCGTRAELVGKLPWPGTAATPGTLNIDGNHGWRLAPPNAIIAADSNCNHRIQTCQSAWLYTCAHRPTDKLFRTTRRCR